MRAATTSITDGDCDHARLLVLVDDWCSLQLFWLAFYVWQRALFTHAVLKKFAAAKARALWIGHGCNVTLYYRWSSAMLLRLLDRYRRIRYADLRGYARLRALWLRAVDIATLQNVC
jgi:hypothetical protein